MTTQPLVDIYNLVFNRGVHMAAIARAMGDSPKMLQVWISGYRKMPANKCRQLADVLEERQAPNAKIAAAKLRAHADMLDATPKPRNKGVASDWITPGTPPPHTRGDKIIPVKY